VQSGSRFGRKVRGFQVSSVARAKQTRGRSSSEQSSLVMQIGLNQTYGLCNSAPGCLYICVVPIANTSITEWEKGGRKRTPAS
jgi:hypothetical protein